MPFSHAVIWLLLSVLFISGPPALWLFWPDGQATPITKIVQCTNANHFLKSFVLADLLDLSCDEPTLRTAFSVDAAEQKLLSTPIIQTASLSFLDDETLVVDYELRHPIAFLGGWENVAVDAEGAIFPFQPFFTPQRLPTIRLIPQEGLPLVWGMHLETTPWQEALEALANVKAKLPINLFLKTLDISREKHTGSALREWIITLETRDGELIYVRLPPHAYEKLTKLEALLPERSSKSSLIDLRFTRMALITDLN